MLMISNVNGGHIVTTLSSQAELKTNIYSSNLIIHSGHTWGCFGIV